MRTKCQISQWASFQRRRFSQGFLESWKVTILIEGGFDLNKQTNTVFLPFEEGRQFARSLKFKTVAQWTDFCSSGNRPNNIPRNPDQSYKGKGWINYGDWLGTGRIATNEKVFVSYKEARKFVRSLNLKNEMEWREYIKTHTLPPNIPRAPYMVYRDKGWISWGDFLGTMPGFTGKYLIFKKAKKKVHALNLKSIPEYREWYDKNLPIDLPRYPNDVYKEWTTAYDWLGITQKESFNYGAKKSWRVRKK